MPTFVPQAARVAQVPEPINPVALGVFAKFTIVPPIAPQRGTEGEGLPLHLARP